MTIDMKPSTHSLIKTLKETGDDNEWYPTSDIMISCIKSDIDNFIEERSLPERPSILDCGAGDGRLLQNLTTGEKFAIEKSRPLIEVMDRSIFVIGADFHQQSLIDVSVGITVSNPPYLDYVNWVEKIVTETRSGLVYLIIPKRWSWQPRIKQAIELRSARTTVIGSFSFNEADRASRAVVDIVRIDLRLNYGRHWHECTASTDPFTIWFDTNFKIKAPSSSSFDNNRPSPTRPRADEINRELVQGSDIVVILVKLYNRQMDKLIANYKALEQMDAALLNELGVRFSDIRAGLKAKISGCKQGYWQELFDRLGRITDRLTKGSREAMLAKLMARTDVDFNASNVYAIVIWAIKNANFYFDQQLVSLVEQMVDKANIINYKSNERTFGKEDWRYRSKPHNLSHFKLDYRVVLERVGGMSLSSYNSDKERYKGLSPSAYFFILDVITVARNIGFDTANQERPDTFDWEANKRQIFHYKDHATDSVRELMSVRAFKNGNMHVSFNQDFIMRINVEFGRLKGWLKCAGNAASELDMSVDLAEEYFSSNLQIATNDLALLAAPKAA